MKKILTYIFTAAALMVSGSVAAQNLNSAYFADGYVMGHQLNPAKEYDRKGYISMPGLTNWNIGLKGNLELTDLVKKMSDGKLVTFLYPGLSESEAMGGFKSNNKMMMDLRLDILSFGFHAFGGYNTFTVGSRTNVGFNMPREMFDLVREISNKNYDISDFGTTVSSWAEIGLGHSHQINDAWRIGAKAKILLGLGYAKVNMDNLQLDLRGTDEWTATANASAEVGVKGFTWGEKKITEYNSKVDANGNPLTYEQIDFDNVDVDGFGLNGGGIAFDLGVEWDMGKQGLVDGLKLSASLLDLGFIKWNTVAMAQNNGEKFVFNGFENIKVEGGDGTEMEDQIDDLGDRLSDLYSLQESGTSSKARALGATLNIAAEYALPAYDKLSFGLLSTTRMQGVYTWNEERLSVTLSPGKMFEISGNVAVGTFGTNVGWLLNFHPRACNIFIGSDHCVGKFAKPFIPKRSSYNVNFGIAFPIGKSRI